MFGFYRNFFPAAPLSDDGSAGTTQAPGNRFPHRLADTGTAESSTNRLTPGKMYMLIVGATSMRVRFSGVGGLVTAVSTTRDVVYPPNAVVPFMADAFSLYVYAEAGDGVSAYEGFVIQYQS